MVQNESLMEIRRVNRWRGIKQIAQCKLESRFVGKEGDLFLALVGATQSNELLEELAGCINVRLLKIDMQASHGLLSHFDAPITLCDSPALLKVATGNAVLRSITEKQVRTCGDETREGRISFPARESNGNMRQQNQTGAV